ncbi:MAG: histidine kinase [Candidatus Promineifilaceae bacterium]|nr:histidine kinase [Candidatus Promineifilaceae bacterium]
MSHNDKKFRLIPSGLHAKVSLGVILPALLILGLFTAIGYQRHREATLAELSKLAAYTGRVVESDLRHQMVESDFEGLQGLLDTIAAQEEIERLYLLDTSGQVIFAPQEKEVGLRLDNGQEQCQPCHSLPVAERPDSIVVSVPGRDRVFRSMAPIENSEECIGCHEEDGRLIGLLLIDISVAPFSKRLTGYLQQNLFLWISFIAISTLAVYIVVNRFVLRRLGQLVSAIGGMSQGKRPPPLPEGPPDEIGQLVRAFNTMTQQVEARNQQNEELSEQLQQQSMQRGRLLRRLITAQEDERMRVARELHDELGQSLTGLALRAEALERHLPGADDGGKSILDQIRTLITDTTDQMYDIIMDLRPSMLDDLGLVSALNAYTERAVESTDLTFTIDDHCFDDRLPPEVETALFRVLQEGITNVLRHADASHITITLACNNGLFEGSLADDGRGFEPKAFQLNGQRTRGLGLLGMHERINQCGGQMEIDSAPGRGTRIRFSIPLPEVLSEREN